MWKILQAKSVLFSEYSMTEETKFMFPQVVQRHYQGGRIINHHLIAY